jgi:hypothetical protein
MILNTQPCHIIQVFKNSYEYDKKFKNFDSRKAIVQWKSDIPSNTKIAESIVLNQNAFDNAEGTLDNLVVLIDDNFYSFEDYKMQLILSDDNLSDEIQIQLNYNKQKQARKSVVLGKLSNKFKDFEIFKIKQEQEIELHLNWDIWTVGEPERFNFKIADLKINQPIQVIIDGKRDFSLTGRRKRTFIENNFIIEYKGIFEQVQLQSNPETFFKTIPTQAKEINLMKYVK